MSEFFATCARGLEPILAQELKDLRADRVELGRGGVSFQGDQATLYRANLWLRTSVRVLQSILVTEAYSPEDLYEVVQSVDWSKYMTPEHTLAVDANVRDSNITHSRYAALKVKDAICDWFVNKEGRRPSVDTDTPMVGLNLHLHQNQVVLSLDSSGESLHKRGYRPILTKAPINEALAAGLLLQTGWRGDTPLVDPMCGSGTFCIEGAWLALRRPPGLTRKRFGFMGWMDYDVRLWTEIRDQARRDMAKKLEVPILGQDLRADAVEFAKTNARSAGLGHALSFQVRDVRDFQPPSGPPGMLICNPPYGERIGDEAELEVLYATLGEAFRARCPGWSLFVFSGNPHLLKKVGLKQSQGWDFFNGPIQCRLVKFERN